MVRFIYIGEQILEGSKDFAFWDTINDRFIDFDGYYVFESVAELIEIYNHVNPINSRDYSLQRLLDLIHRDKVFEDNAKA